MANKPDSHDVAYHAPRQVSSNGLTLTYDSFGRAEDPALLLIHGLGMQLIDWDPALCRLLAQAGLRVIRFDNRDVGLSTHFHDRPVPNIAAVALAVAEGSDPGLPYTLGDMAADAAGLLDALAIERAHVVGVSMGGMIAQRLAIHHGSRLLSLTSIMSTTGGRDLPPPAPEAVAILLAPPPADRAAYIERSVADARILSAGYPPDETAQRAQAAARYDRAFDPAGVGRQFAAVLGDGSRREALRGVTVPTLAIHGAEDPLVPAAGGRDTADHIPGARLLTLPRMGHDLPPALYAAVTTAISDHARSAVGA